MPYYQRQPLPDLTKADQKSPSDGHLPGDSRPTKTPVPTREQLERQKKQEEYDRFRLQKFEIQVDPAPEKAPKRMDIQELIDTFYNRISKDLYATLPRPVKRILWFYHKQFPSERHRRFALGELPVPQTATCRPLYTVSCLPAGLWDFYKEFVFENYVCLFSRRSHDENLTLYYHPL